MKLKYDTQVYDIRGNEFAVLSKGTEIELLHVDRNFFKIGWMRGKDSKFGFLGFKQFLICVDQDDMFKKKEKKEKKETKETKKNCKTCKNKGNCTIKIKNIFQNCANYEEME